MVKSVRQALVVGGFLMAFLCFFVPQDQFLWMVSLFGLTFIIYLYGGQLALPYGVRTSGYNLMLKCVLVFAFPRASDDIYRFFWDGQAWIHGISAYQFKPSELVLHQLKDFESTFQRLNSREYYSVYPPLLQFLFALCAFLSFKSVVLFSVCWKCILLLADQMTIRYLKRMPVHFPKALYWYAWNPLILFEVFGNGHPEGLMIGFLVLAFYFIQVHQLRLSALAMSLAIGIKLIPAFLLPFFMPFLGLKKFLNYMMYTGPLLILLLLPILPYPDHFYASLQLYFKNFEFNGSIYELWKAIDYLRFGFNNISSIGPWMAVSFVVAILVLVLLQKKSGVLPLLRSCLMGWMIYLLLSTTVHPWYILPVMTLGILSGYFFPVIWSGAAILSYSWYADQISLTLKYVFIALEYTILTVFLVWELRYNRNTP